MTNQEFINLAKTCKNRTELLAKIAPTAADTRANYNKYIAPLRIAAGLTVPQLTALFVK